MMAAAMWTKPHVIAFDEPTNYLDFQRSGRKQIPSASSEKCCGLVRLRTEDGEFAREGDQTV